MNYHVGIIGGGPAGLTASIFATRAGLKTICFEKLAIGGQASLSYEIANFPGYEKISGYELMQKMYNQAKALGTEFKFGEVLKVSQTKLGFTIKTKNEIFKCKKLIIACGNEPKKLGLNENRFIGKGVSYCASCDGNFFKGKDVAIVGGGDSAFQYAEYLSRIVNKVYLLNRSEKFKAHAYRVDRVKKIKNVKILTNIKVEELVGQETISSIVINNGKKQNLKVNGVFVAIGHSPNLDFLNFEIKVDKNGYILANNEMETSVKNVYACGDILSKHFKQVVTACSDGAIAGNSCVGEL